MTDFIKLFNRAFNRDDFDDFCNSKKEEKTFTKIIGKFYLQNKFKEFNIKLTNDPLKMIGCGFTIPSSYSPTSPSFKYLPSFVLQDYIGMIYITDGTSVVRDINGIKFKAPRYIARAFVMITKTGRILFKMPTYTEYDDFFWAFDSVKEVGYGCVYSKTKAPEIHLDVLKLYYCPDSKRDKRYEKQHLALCGHMYPSREAEDIYKERKNNGIFANFLRGK